MLPTSEPSSSDQQTPIGILSYLEEEQAKKKPTGSKRHSKRKNELGGEYTNKERESRPSLTEVISPIPTIPPPETSPSQPSREVDRANGSVSPLLAGFGAVTNTDNTGFDPGEWASQVPYGISPPNGDDGGVSLGGSPPSANRRYGEELRGGFTTVSPSVSPRAAYRIPVRRNPSQQVYKDLLGSSPSKDMSPPLLPQYPQGPPLPHHPQAHFYEPYNTDLRMHQPHTETHKHDTADCCMFDSLASAGDSATATMDNILLMGFEKGIAVYKVDKERYTLLGRLEGLRGTVVGAKIIPCALRKDLLRWTRPLIALIIHGPAEQSTSERARSTSPDVNLKPPQSPQHSPRLTDPSIEHPAFYQTTVEVYSLSRQKHISTLFRSSILEAEIGYNGQSHTRPPPIGNLSLQAKGRFIIISSGNSGEVYIFEALRYVSTTLNEAFRCIGKTWTSIPIRKPRSWSNASTSSEQDSLLEAQSPRLVRPEAPIVSLSHKWLAIVHPIQTPGRATIHGKVHVPPPPTPKPPGLTSHAASTQPLVTAELDLPIKDSSLNKIAQNVTQEVIRGTLWAAERGSKAWTNYWAKPGDGSTSTAPATFPEQRRSYQTNRDAANMFPPTHANDDRKKPAAKSQPAMVSILDLDNLAENHDLKKPPFQPVATFSLPDGCSFVSFAPSGLNLLTASSKGDVQKIWDLMRMVYSRTKTTLNADGEVIDQKPCVRQIAQFTRMTMANIVDVAWTEPRGDRFAIITDRGTVHIHDLPSSAFQWPPPHRLGRPSSLPRGPSTDRTGLPSTDASESRGLPMIGRIVSGSTQPFFNAFSARAPNVNNPNTGLGGFALPAGVKGGKVVAHGVSKSMDLATGTINSLRHIGENRLHVPGDFGTITPDCVRWLSGKDTCLLAVTGGGMLRIHQVRESAGSHGKRRPSVIGDKPNEFTLPSTFDKIAQASDDRNSSAGMEFLTGTCWPVVTQGAHLHKGTRQETHPLSYAEIETNAPYQPFHTDRRVTFRIYTSTDGSDPHHLIDKSPWVFGEEIPTTQVTVQRTISDAMEGLVSTQKGRGRRQDVNDEREDFFEGDCEVVDFAEDRV
ncbi:MAG: hypothetical protein MMC33_004552 [Icmadophila ericetorum]|nr:hypothetical protein [Icmadophila ericetorum]